MSELEVDYRGRVDLIFYTTHCAVIMGAEIKASSSASQERSIRRYKTIALRLQVATISDLAIS